MSNNSAILFKTHQAYYAMLTWYDKRLEQITVPFTSQKIETRFGSTHLLMAGNPEHPPLFILHGATSNAAVHTADINFFSERYFVIAPDRIGEPGKSAPVRPSRFGTGYADWLMDVMDAFSIEQAVFMGASLGAWNVLKLATVAPQRIQKAALITPAGIVPMNWRFALRIIIAYLLDTIQSSYQSLQKTMRSMAVAEADVDETLVQFFAMIAKDFKAELSMPYNFSTADLQHLTVPVFVIAGQYDPIFLVKKLVPRLHKRLPNLIDVSLVPMGHLPGQHQVIEILARINDFLSTY